MRPPHQRNLIPATLLALLGLTAPAAAQVAAQYTLTDLGLPGTSSRAYGITNGATGPQTVVGWLSGPGPRLATEWVGGGAPVTLVPLAGDTTSEARGVNVVNGVTTPVGFSTNAAGTADKAVSWTGTVPNNLLITSAPAFTGAPVPFTQSRAEAISPTGEIVGHAYSDGNFDTGSPNFPAGLRGFYRSPGGAVTRLDPITGTSNFPLDAALSYGINSSSQVFGQTDDGSGTDINYRGVRWGSPSGSNTNPLINGLVYPTAAGLPQYFGFKGNNANRIAGTASDQTIAAQATRSQGFASDGTTTTLLDNLGGNGAGFFGIVNAINNAAINVLVGGSGSGAGLGSGEHATAWNWSGTNPTVTPIDLNTRLLANPTNMTLIEAFDVNDNGQIVGYGSVGGIEHAFLLTPVPEPGTLALVGLGLGGLALRTWRRRRAG
ncbi:MAG TPA: PEP-CTERM sorting domain-containing protein [Gemmataceae bacterium]